MGTKDISRLMFDPRKHYTASWMQQGRVVTDFDQNDGEAIALEERRRSRVDIIGPYGSPDDGFRITNARRVGPQGNQIDFDINAGTLYLGGLRLELETLQTFLGQTDMLNLSPVGAPNPNAARRDLVLLEAFEAPVTAVEDGELLDPALGGADTAARGRRFQRVHVIPNVNAQDCDQAWDVIAALMAAANAGSVGPDYRRVVDTRLTVTYTDEGVDDDLCEPPLTGGYLGAENQAIRVQIVAPGLFTWGYDNAAPLYRVALSADRTRVTLLTPPRDEYSTPVAGQVIELLPWGAVLPNGEKTAALSGHLTRIADVDPNDESAGGAITVTLVDPVPNATFEEWRTRADAAELQADGVYYFMHIWNRGGDLGSPPAIATGPGPITLGTTGIQVTFTGNDQVPEDYWIISARPETPTQALPWLLEDGAPPVGVARYFAPLALIHWRNNGTARVTDCRPPFRPLTSLNGCCTYTVGDGKTSDGDYNDLALALERLGDGGGEICLLPGTHRANVVLENRANITISGCGGRSRLIPADPAATATILARNCASLGFYNFDLVNVTGTGLQAENIDGLTVRDVNVLGGVVGFDVENGRDVEFRRCLVRMLDREGGDVGIYAQGERILIQECDIQVIPAGNLPVPPEEEQDPDKPPVDPTDPCADPEGFYTNFGYLIFYVNVIWGLYTYFTFPTAPYLTLGGIQIGSGSEQVKILTNGVAGGAGNGITLGSDVGDVILEQPPDQPDGGEQPTGMSIGHESERVRGQLWYQDAPIGGMTVLFENQAGQTFAFPASADGTFAGQLAPGNYTVSVSDPLYRVIDIETLDLGAYYIFLGDNDIDRPQPTGGNDILAFIHDVRIEDNTIASMSLAGIGAPRFETSDAAVLSQLFVSRREGRADLQLMLLVYLLTGTITGFVVDLVIYRNRIMRCLLDAPLPEGGDMFTIERALGGIALALVDGLTLAENVIEDCGDDARTPVCGIFTAFSIDVTARENHVLNNGGDTRARQVTADFLGASDFTATPPAPSAGPGPSSQPNVMTRRSRLVGSNTEFVNVANYQKFNRAQAVGSFVAVPPTLDLAPGPRGGIVLPICISANVFMGGRTKLVGDIPQDVTTVAEGRHAARVDGNYVVQPFGKALFLGAVGSVVVTGNQLISDRALTRDQDRRAGGITGLLAGNMALAGTDMSPSNTLVFNLATGGANIELLRLIAPAQRTRLAAFDAAATAIDFPLGFPDGNVLFVGNQIKQGDSGERPTVVTVFSLDDVNFADNQIDVLNGDAVRSTAVVFAVSARSDSNRMKEPITTALSSAGAANVPLDRYSLVQIALMGTMQGNQGNYCFRHLASLRFTQGNLSMLGSFMQCPADEPEVPATLSAVFLVLLLLSARYSATFFQVKTSG